MNKIARLAGFTAALLLSGCYIERVSPPTAVYPVYDSDYRYGDYGSDYSSDGYGSDYGSGYGSGYGYATPSPLPSIRHGENGNRQPILQALSANPGFAVAPGQMITFTVGTYDRDNDPLQLTWSATGGVLSADSGRTVAYMPPSQPGVYTVQVFISDGRGGTVTGAQNILVDDRGTTTVIKPGPAPTPKPTAQPTAPPLAWSTPAPTATPIPTPKPSKTPRVIPTPTPMPTPTPLPEEWVTNEDDLDDDAL